MPWAHPIELRERAVAAYEAGEGSYSAVAERFGISHRALTRWVARKRRFGTLDTLPRGGGNPSTIDLERLDALIGERPDSTTHELTAEYNRGLPRALRVHRSSIQRALARAGYVFKKNGPVRRSKTGPMSR